MAHSKSGESWQLVLENREQVIAALERGECEGILPAASGLFDDFASFCGEIGLLELLSRLPDERERRSIPACFFGNLLVHKALFRIPTLTQATRVLFHSPDTLRRLGFNWRQIQEGFYSNGERKPFNEEALADFFAGIGRQRLWKYQLQVLGELLKRCPELLGGGTLTMDCVTVTVPAGHFKREGGQYKACVLSGYREGRIYPLLCLFGGEHESDLVLGKRMMKAAAKLLAPKPGEAKRELLLDRGFIDGAWIGELKEQGFEVVIGARSDMNIYEDLVGLSRLPRTKWQRVDPPKYHERERPKRYVTGFKELKTWEACPVPLSGVVIRDEYTDHTSYQVVVSTDERLSATQLHACHRARWEIEEAFMALTRYWNIDELGSCRHPVYLAQVYFTLLAYALLGVFADRQAAEPLLPPLALFPGRELVVYHGAHYAILLPSELFQIVFTHFDAWRANQEKLLEALRHCEGRAPP